MKILIVAGPYEADRIRRAAVSAGVEAIAVEPGESLSGWITATRPEVIVLAPRVISPEPTAALAKIRAVPRGRVPVLLVGDAEEEVELRPLADGFFVRPVAAEDLIQQARAAMAARILRGPPDRPRPAPPMAETGRLTPATGRLMSPRAPALRPLMAAPVGPSEALDTTPMVLPDARVLDDSPLGAVLESRGSFGLRDSGRPAGELAGASTTRSPTGRRGPRGAGFFEQLSDDIDAHMDADLEAEARDLARVVDGLRQTGKVPVAAGTPPTAAPAARSAAASARAAPGSSGSTPATLASAAASTPGAGPPRDADDGSTHVAGAVPEVAAEDVATGIMDRAAAESISELTDERSQKTLEVPHVPAAAADELDLDPPALLARMYLSRLSGRLTVRRGPAKKHIVFERGHPVLAGSNRPEDRLGEMLVRQGRITAAQAVSLGDEAAATGRRLGLVLVDRGLIAGSELTGIVRRHYEEIVYSLFSWDKGAWTLGTDGSIAAEKVLLSLHPAALILEGIRRGSGVARTLAALGGEAEVFQLRPWAGLSELLDKMGLDPPERRVVLLFDGMQSLAAIAAASGGLSADRVYALAWALFVLDRLEPAPAGKDIVSAASARGAGGPASGAASNGPRGGRERDEAIDRALVQARAALVADGDYFQILGVPRDAEPEEIRRAHQILLAGLRPGSLHPAVASDLEAELRDIRLVLDEATRLLLDDDLRRAYREHLAVPPDLVLAAPAEAAPDA